MDEKTNYNQSISSNGKEINLFFLNWWKNLINFNNFSCQSAKYVL